MDQRQSKNSPATQKSPNPANFALSRTDVVIIGLVCIGVGVALGFFLPALGSIAAKFPIPFGEVIEKLSRFDQPWVITLRPVIGAALGLIAAFFIAAATTPLRVDEDGITIGRDDDHPLRISRTSFSTAYFADGKLVVLTEGGHEAFKGDVEGKKDAIAEAFTSRGYRWGEI
ncbi:YqeB family protein [Brevibacterium spongiae]|uniref:YqeB PH domain-containing protein n=1 Tax=Brevibacterium spongiae TaxID=2909672 RepID=A0ABY5SPX8_9MICO|nr:hypothetical protein [Brevibacterium spongiae]UVI36200.1 hypothetical protein L1F31_00600 [Brevibacterium spongiae]